MDIINIFLTYKSFFIKGIIGTLSLSFISVLIGIFIGIILSLFKLSKSKILKYFASIYIEIIRGTPLLLQLFIVYFGSDLLFGIKLNEYVSGIVAVSLNSGAYVAEIMRSGIEAIDRGQSEAAQSLGLDYYTTIYEIILPQAIKNILPALGNEFVSIIKETSIVSVIGANDIMRQVDVVRAITFKPIEPLFIVAIIYFMITFILSKTVNLFEKKLKK